jgi:uncharacterized caspase-like protein
VLAISKWVQLLLLFSVLFFSASAFSHDHNVLRFALVAGNNDYAASPLKNAVNDARDIATALEDIGFTVTLIENANKASLQQAVEAYYTSLSGFASDKVLAVVYYAGHAVQINHSNYLVPLGYNDHENSFIDSLYNINSLLDQIPRDRDISNIIILDACRDNPFGDQIQTSGDGLAPLRAPAATLIAYSTEPGNVAQDGTGDNGIYTHHLLKHIKKRVPTDEVFRRVRKAVARETGKRQIPWEHSSLIDEVYFHTPRNKEMPGLLSF